MEIKIIKQKDVPLFSRKRITALVTSTGQSTPNKKSLQLSLSKLLKTKPNLVAIRHIYQQYGSAKAKAIVHIYDKEEDLKYFESAKTIFKEEKKEEPKELSQGTTSKESKE
ncbi:MAG: hypothetical protein U9Q69_02565 [Nanoarchaeota archaeon]|nr:hypothetical protein [Nanoarchaeota archaeon]